MTDRKAPKVKDLSDLQESTKRSLVIDNGYSFVFSTDMRDWIMQKKRRQELESRKRIRNGEKRRPYKAR
jgi:hypothetical protein|tara:strand:- start:490 stop:696 length:207 start_codon:yes stop_codon:yes gene_type:complete